MFVIVICICNLYFHLYLYSVSVGATVALPEKVETICGSVECLPNGTLLEEMRMHKYKYKYKYKNKYKYKCQIYICQVFDSLPSPGSLSDALADKLRMSRTSLAEVITMVHNDFDAGDV